MPVRMLPPELLIDCTRMEALDAELQTLLYSQHCRDRRRPLRKQRIVSYGGPRWRAEKKMTQRERRRSYLQDAGRFEQLRKEFGS